MQSASRAVTVDHAGSRTKEVRNEQSYSRCIQAQESWKGVWSKYLDERGGEWEDR